MKNHYISDARLCKPMTCCILRKLGMQLELGTTSIHEASDFLLDKYDVHIQPEMYVKHNVGIIWKATIFYKENGKVVMGDTIDMCATRNDAISSAIEFTLKKYILC